MYFESIALKDEELDSECQNETEVTATSSSLEPTKHTEGSGVLDHTWNRQNTFLFLEEYKKHYQDFRDPKKKKRNIWEEIAQTMRSWGYHVSADILDRKLRNMKNTYKVILENSNKAGRGPPKWEYFHIFQELYKNDWSINVTKPSATDNKKGANSSLKRKLHEHRVRKLDEYRKKQIEVEEEKVAELKKITQALEVHNQLQREKIELLKESLRQKTRENCK